MPCPPRLELRQRDGRAVTGGGDDEGSGRHDGGVVVSTPAAGGQGHARHEGTTHLTERVRLRRGELDQRRRDGAMVGGVDADGGGEGPSVSLSLGQARARLDVGVQRDGDGREDTDDGDNDHQLDEREAALVAQHLPFTIPEPVHFCFLPEALWPFGRVWKVELLLGERECIYGAMSASRRTVRSLTVGPEGSRGSLGPNW